MCGIYGFIGKSDKNTSKIIRALGSMNESRGTDSTGIAIIKHDSKNTRVFKQCVNASCYLNKIKLSKHIGIDNDVTILGHTRLATTGAITRANAHPHIINNIVFTHNGMIYNFDDLQARYNTRYNVDSQIIPHLLSTNRYQWVFGRALSGSFVAPFVSLNRRDRLYIARHNNPLTLAITLNGVYYTSEYNHMYEAFKKVKQEVDIQPTQDNFLYIIDNDTIKEYPLKIKQRYTYPSYNWHRPYHSLGYYFDSGGGDINEM